MHMLSPRGNAKPGVLMVSCSVVGCCRWTVGCLGGGGSVIGLRAGARVFDQSVLRPCRHPNQLLWLGLPARRQLWFDGGFVFVTIPDGNFSGQEQSLFTSNQDGTFSDQLAVPANQAAGTYATGVSCFTNSDPAGWPQVPDYQPFEVTGAQEEPLCGPPGEELPATIVGAGTIFGTRGDDVIVASPGNDFVFGGGGNDFICGEGGNDTLDGGKGNDVVIGDELDSVPFAPSNGANDDTLRGGPGDDTLAGLGGDDTLEGGPGDDQIIGFGGVDTIAGGPGNDSAFGGPLDDRMSGGPDDDTLWGNFGSE